MGAIMLTIIVSAVLACVCCGSSDYVSEELLERIKALEAKDAARASKIEQLEHHSVTTHGEILRLRETNTVLQRDNAMTIAERNNQDDRIEKLVTRLEDLMVVRKKDQNIIRKLQNKVTVLKQRENNLERKIYKMDKIFVKYQKDINEISNLINKSEEEKSEKDKQFKSTRTDRNDKNEFLNKTGNVPKSDSSNWSEQTDKFTHVTEIMKTKRQQNIDKRQTPSDIAFHAVLSPNLVQHLGINQYIKFDQVLLNLGRGYHNQLGVFIAPKTGVYLISVSVATPRNTEFSADIMKDGSRLAGVLGRSEEYHYQSAVTVVTHMDVGNELWVEHTHPADGSIWGNSYTSFSGVLMF